MAIDIVRGAIKNQFAANDLIEAMSSVQKKYTGTLFLSYPLSATTDGNDRCFISYKRKRNGSFYF